MRSILIMLFILPFTAMAQLPRDGWYAGAGIGGTFYNTHWYYHRADGNPYHDNYPSHSVNRTVLLLSLEKRGILKIRNRYNDGQAPDKPYRFDFDAGGDLVLGVKGRTKADWLAGEPVVSSGGYSVGLNGYFKGLIVLPASKTMNLSPFIGLGPQLAMLHNNGKGVEPIASAGYYNYKESWNEYVLNLTFSLGVGLEFRECSVVPELRIGLGGIATSSWYPNADGVSRDGGPGYWGLGIKVLKKL